ncbi:HEPN domain-containing protein [Rhizobium sp. FKY42]|uniref:HEPN domain-containing protein n=1 Tax=Rhizobium sp. FKY42 TaxID=2562310 RepID=UPI0010C11228|nr:HEPN domain-containing protein [Rhizobium sp. FKY42]
MKLSPVEMSLDQRKADLIWHVFIDPADGNYLTARWAYENGLFHQFYWDAAQCLEKLMKAALLLNNIDVKEHDHDLTVLFGALSAIDHTGLLPRIIKLPDTTAQGRETWEGQPYSLFIEDMDRFGSADNRYGNIGTFVNGPVIHILDEVCFYLRIFLRKITSLMTISTELIVKIRTGPTKSLVLWTG